MVAKLFGIVQPDRAYFGQKDGQQTVVVRKLARDLDMGVDVVVLPTVREPDGLAMSSRNVRLKPDERQAATAVFRALSAGHEAWRNGESNAESIRNAVRGELAREPLLGQVDYVSLAAGESLEELDTAAAGAMLSTAVHLGAVRLIDNVVLE